MRLTGFYKCSIHNASWQLVKLTKRDKEGDKKVKEEVTRGTRNRTNERRRGNRVNS